MKAVTRILGQAVAAAAVAVTILLGRLSAQEADAKPNKDTRSMEVKVQDLKEGCESTGGPDGKKDGKGRK